MYSPADLTTLRRLITTSHGRHAIKELYGWVNKVDTCRYVTLSSYFDFLQTPCQKCDICRGELNTSEFKEVILTLNDKLLCQTIHELGNNYGKTIPIDYLHGSKNKKIRMVIQRRSTYGKMTTYGKGKHITKEKWKQIHDRLVTNGTIQEHLTPGGYIIYKIKK